MAQKRQPNFDDLLQGGTQKRQPNFNNLTTSDSSIDPTTSDSSISRLLGKFSQGASPVLASTVLGAKLGSPLGPKGVAGGTVLGSTVLPLADLISQGYNAAVRNLGFPKAQIVPTSKYIQGLLGDKPKTTAERAALAAGEASGMVGGQLPGLLRLSQVAANPTLRGISGTLATAPKTQMVVAPTAAATSQVVTEKTDSPAAGLASSILTGLAIGKAGTPRFKFTTGDQLKTAASRSYKEADNANIVLPENEVLRLRENIIKTIKKEGYNANLHPKVTKALSILGQDSKDETLMSLDQLRRGFRDLARNPDESRIVGAAIDAFDKHLLALKPSSFKIGNAASGITSLIKARELWQRSKKVEVIEDIIANAKLAAGANYTQAGLETALRQQFRALAKKNPGKSSPIDRFSAEEQKAIIKIVKGGKGENLARIIGRIASIRGPISAVPTMVPLYYGEPVIAGIIAAAGESARRGASALTKRNVGNLRKTITGDVKPPSNVRPGAIRGLLSDPNIGSELF
tara:strand:+ start:15542 stop:17089 length:1548 start_codon:yes stop_codon:yes gene_type:complete